MPSQSRRELILEAIVARLEAIAVSHDTIEFATNAGASVHLGAAPGFGPDDPTQAIVVVAGDDEAAFQGEGFLVRLPIGIQAIVSADLSAPYASAEAVLADIKRAIELTDRTLGGLVAWNGLERGVTRTLQRDEGSTFVGVEIEYSAHYTEGWGAP